MVVLLLLTLVLVVLLLVLLLLLLVLVVPLGVVVLTRVLREILPGMLARVCLGEGTRARLKVGCLGLESKGRRASGDRVVWDGVAQHHRSAALIPARVVLLRREEAVPLLVVVVLLLKGVAIAPGDEEEGSVGGGVLSRVLLSEGLRLLVGGRRLKALAGEGRVEAASIPVDCVGPVV